jgi:hypothetical protein
MDNPLRGKKGEKKPRGKGEIMGRKRSCKV